MPPKKRKMASRKQWAWAFATGQKFANRWARNTTGTSKRGTKRGKKAYGSLPKKVKHKSTKRVKAGRKAARTRKRRGK